MAGAGSFNKWLLNNAVGLFFGWIAILGSVFMFFDNREREMQRRLTTMEIKIEAHDEVFQSLPSINDRLTRMETLLEVLLKEKLVYEGIKP